MAVSKEGNYTLRPNTHSNDVMQALDKQRKARDKDLCDVILAVEGTLAVAHKSVLAACSNYFRHYFKEKQEIQNSNGLKKIKSRKISRCDSLSPSSASQSTSSCESPPMKRRKTVSESLPAYIPILSSPLSPYSTNTPPPTPLTESPISCPSKLFKNRNSPSNAVILPGIKAKALHLILDYMYSSAITINKENIQDLLLVSCLLQIRPVVDACIKILAKEVTWRIAPSTSPNNNKISVRLSSKLRRQNEALTKLSEAEDRKENSKVRFKTNDDEKPFTETAMKCEESNRSTTKRELTNQNIAIHSAKKEWRGPAHAKSREETIAIARNAKINGREELISKPVSNRVISEKEPFDKDVAAMETDKQCLETDRIEKSKPGTFQRKHSTTKPRQSFVAQEKEIVSIKHDSSVEGCCAFMEENDNSQVLDLRQKQNNDIIKDYEYSETNIFGRNVKTTKVENTLTSPIQVQEKIPLRQDTKLLSTTYRNEHTLTEPSHPKKNTPLLFPHDDQHFGRLQLLPDPEQLFRPPSMFDISSNFLPPGGCHLANSHINTNLLLRNQQSLNSTDNSKYAETIYNMSGKTNSAVPASFIPINSLRKHPVVPINALSLWPILSESLPYFKPEYRQPLLHYAPTYLPNRNISELQKIKTFPDFSKTPYPLPDACNPFDINNTLEKLSRTNPKESLANYKNTLAMSNIKSTFNNEKGFRANSIESP